MRALPVAPLRHPTTCSYVEPCRNMTRRTGVAATCLPALDLPACISDPPKQIFNARATGRVPSVPDPRSHFRSCRNMTFRAGVTGHVTSQHPSFPRAARTGRNRSSTHAVLAGYLRYSVGPLAARIQRSRSSTHAVPAEYLRHATDPLAARIHRSRPSTHAHPPRISVPNLACTSSTPKHGSQCRRYRPRTFRYAAPLAPGTVPKHNPRCRQSLRERPGKCVSALAHLLEFSSLLSDPPSSASSTSPSYPFDVFDALSMRVRELGSLRF